MHSKLFNIKEFLILLKMLYEIFMKIDFSFWDRDELQYFNNKFKINHIKFKVLEYIR